MTLGRIPHLDPCPSGHIPHLDPCPSLSIWQRLQMTVSTSQRAITAWSRKTTQTGRPGHSKTGSGYDTPHSWRTAKVPNTSCLFCSLINVHSFTQITHLSCAFPRFRKLIQTSLCTPLPSPHPQRHQAHSQTPW